MPHRPTLWARTSLQLAFDVAGRAAPARISLGWAWECRQSQARHRCGEHRPSYPSFMGLASSSRLATAHRWPPGSQNPRRDVADLCATTPVFPHGSPALSECCSSVALPNARAAALPPWRLCIRRQSPSNPRPAPPRPRPLNLAFQDLEKMPNPRARTATTDLDTVLSRISSSSSHPFPLLVSCKPKLTRPAPSASRRLAWGS